MGSMILDYLSKLKLPEAATDALANRSIEMFDAATRDPALAELRALHKAVERLGWQVHHDVRNGNIFDDTILIEGSRGRTERNIAYDAVPVVSHAVEKGWGKLSGIESGIGNMRELLKKGRKNPEKIQIGKALDTAFAHDTQNHMKQLQRDFKTWAGEHEGYLEQYGTQLNASTRACAEAARDIAAHAAARCGTIELRAAKGSARG